jgi:DNA-binding phage protein
MPKRTVDHHEWLLKELQDPRLATGYLNEALQDSPEMFAIALRNVAEAYHRAEETGARRAALDHTLAEEDNPRLHTVSAILKAVGLTLRIAEVERL